eukprot:316411-Pyramimonas_sp.AAC.1
MCTSPFPLVGASKSIFLGAIAASASTRAFADGRETQQCSKPPLKTYKGPVTLSGYQTEMRAP